jgi:hypothetical protein
VLHSPGLTEVDQGRKFRISENLFEKMKRVEKAQWEGVNVVNEL